MEVVGRGQGASSEKKQESYAVDYNDKIQDRIQLSFFNILKCPHWSSRGIPGSPYTIPGEGTCKRCWFRFAKYRVGVGDGYTLCMKLSLRREKRRVGIRGERDYAMLYETTKVDIGCKLKNLD